MLFFFRFVDNACMHCELMNWLCARIVAHQTAILPSGSGNTGLRQTEVVRKSRGGGFPGAAGERETIDTP